MKTHISLNVSNVAESVEFYKKMFSIEPLKLKPDYAKFDVENPPLNLTMNQINFNRGGSLSHLGLQVETTDEVLEMTKRWSDKRLENFGRNENRLLLRAARQNLGARPGRQSLGSFHGSGKHGR